ncbi:SpoIID/LytB domain-containing protein [Fusobacterium sp. PH5-44]|uniref:SpoIID/LytB domain-containing protein n=1 Tax=unclassified Fusobacterium TaxID=2648384 RepID=UPI003D1A204D
MKKVVKMKEIFFGRKLSILIVLGIGIFLASCSGSRQSSGGGGYASMPTEPVSKPSYSAADYQLDYSYFKNNKLPIPNNFRGNSVGYLVPGKEVADSGYDFFTKYNESKALSFYKNLKLRGAGDNSSYWRWKITFNENSFYATVASGLVSQSKSRPNDVLTLSGNSWVKKSVSKADVGNIKDVKVGARGKSGIVTYLIVYTDKNTFLVSKELTIRRTIVPGNNSLYGAKGGEESYGSSPFKTNLNMLPSGYFAIEKSSGKITLYGGGYGHGVGMSQYAAHDLTSNKNHSYIDVLKRYYPNTTIKNMYKITGVTENIRVGISTSGGGMAHSKVVMTASGKAKIKGQGINISVGPSDRIEIINSGGKLTVSVSGKQRGQVTGKVTIESSGNYITLNGVRKAHTSNPSYRGIIEINPSGKGLKVINEVYIEDYLKQVLPSEMPKSFGVEALKAQAVAARTYALSDYLKNKYQNEGFHVKDTVESQVYNNQVENNESNEAIKATNGQVMIYNEAPIDAKYFSTSSGFIEAANYVW